MVDLGSIHSSFKMAPYASIILIPEKPLYQIAEVNEVFLRLTHSDRSIVGRGFFEAFPPNDDDTGERTGKIEKAFEYVINNKIAYNIPVHRYDIKGIAEHNIRYWSLDTFPMLDEDDEVKYIVFSITDITESKRAGDLQQLEHDVLELNSQKNTDIKEVLMTYLKGLEALFPYMQSSILQVSNGKLYSLVSPSLPIAYQKYIDGEEIGPESGSCGTAAYTKSTILSVDIQADSRWQRYKKVAAQFNLAACWSYPIIDTNGKVMSVLSVYSASSRQPSDIETEILDRVVALLEVIMENKQYAESLKETTMLMIQGQELAQFGNWSWDIQSDLVNWSDALYKIYGLNRDEFPATFEGYLNLLHPDDKESVCEIIQEVLKTKSDVEFEERIVRPDGEVRTLKSWGKVKLDRRGQPLKMIGACLDITEAKKKERELQVNNELFKYVNKATNDAIYDWDILNNKISWGDGFARMSGFDPNEEVYNIEKWALHVHPRDIAEVKVDLENALDDPEANNWSFEYRFRRKDGSYANVEENGYIVRDSMGRARRMIGVMRDISRLREIAWAQTHLVREPLTRIMSLSKLLSEKDTDSATKEKLLNYLNASAEELDKVVKEIVNKSEEPL